MEHASKPLVWALWACVVGVSACSPSASYVPRSVGGEPLPPPPSGAPEEEMAAAEAPAMYMRGAATTAATPAEPQPETQFNTEQYDHTPESGFRAVLEHPLSTFSVDVDTASYSNLRRFLFNGQRPPIDSIRVEELINYFDYDYPEPEGEDPIAVATEVSDCPWNPDHRLVRVGLRAHERTRTRPAKNLVFLLDVSGSMESPNKLPLLREAMKMLVRQLDERDTVSIVTYAGSSGVALNPTPGDARDAILDALDELRAGGSTNGADGIQLAYDLADASRRTDGINRVILATDGDFNVGITDRGSLMRLIERERDRGVFLTVLGFGMGNLKDATMEMLADEGNGNYAYIDTAHEARKVLVDEISATLHTVAKDTKIQVELNPARVER